MLSKFESVIIDSISAWIKMLGIRAWNMCECKNCSKRKAIIDSNEVMIESSYGYGVASLDRLSYKSVYSLTTVILITFSFGSYDLLLLK